MPDELIATPLIRFDPECLGASMVSNPDEYPMTAYGSKYELLDREVLAGW